MNKPASLLLSFMLLGAVMPSANAEVSSAIQEMLTRGDYPSALGRIDEELKKNTLDEGLLLARGFTLMQMNQLEEAAAYYKKLREVLKHNPEPGNNLGMVYRKQKDYLAAIRTFGETIRDFPNYTPAHINLGDTYIEIAQLRYQRGFDTTGNVMLQQKSVLAADFEQLAQRALQDNARLIYEQGARAAARPKLTSPPEPAPEPAPAKRPADPVQEIVQKLEAWTEAWMSRDPQRYFSHYAQDFKPERYSLETWMQRKRDVMDRSEFIKLLLDKLDIQLDPEDSNIATVTFNQRYVSNSYAENARKEMIMRKNEHGWLIVEERNIRYKPG